MQGKVDRRDFLKLAGLGGAVFVSGLAGGAATVGPTRARRPERLLSRVVRGWVRGRAREVEAVRHVARLRVAGVQGAQAEERSAEFQQAHVRMQHPGDVSALR